MHGGGNIGSRRVGDSSKMTLGKLVKRNFLQGDRLIVTLITVFLVLYLLEATTFKKTRLEDSVGPGGFPILIAVIGLGLCFIFYINVFRNLMPEYEKTKGVWHEIKGIAMLFLVIVYVILIDLISYEAATFLFMTVSVKFLGERKWLVAAIVAGVLTAACHLFFVWFLDIHFETGDFWLMLTGA